MFVALAAVTNALDLPTTIAQTLGLRETGQQPLAEQLTRYLRPRELLLVLDNVEQIADAGPAVVRLLEPNPRLTILVTSRIPLHLYAEQEFPLPPLALPTPAQLATLGDLDSNPAVALFTQRARAVRPDVCLTARIRAGCGRDLPPAGWVAARDRVGGGARESAVAAGAAGAAGTPPDVTDGGPARRGRAASDAARDHRLEL